VAELIDLSQGARSVVVRERAQVLSRAGGLREQSARLHALVEQVDGELAGTERLLRQMDEILGLAPQLAIDTQHDQLRGERLREIAVEVLREQRGDNAEIHYSDWLKLLEAQGLRVGGKDPAATLLTQLARSPYVESVRPRSGLYRLKSA
jgi:hypothetical protein